MGPILRPMPGDNDLSTLEGNTWWKSWEMLWCLC